jgi:hypothetical protein
MVGDDDEVRLEHAIEMYRSLPTANSPSFPVPRMACQWRSPTSAT